jgi:large subunit ribosomal protein L1
MPNPKAGTVVPAEDLPRVIQEAKAGRVEFRVDKTSNIHVPIGKVSFELISCTITWLLSWKPSRKLARRQPRVQYIKKVTLTTTMGPGIKIDPLQAQQMEVQD